ncbi:hypothetical protein [Paenibacillus glacialis]|uniref:Uncharacterized protein n=1 Tax=Paenibacillus glacialis TaxID=494026 RepID=A0A162K8F0_9BACL|nr:hypothetical protein [Paenibacillus glacialis]OAB44516.1 hypothetical protein PGLA_07630 [Paenibacillus glacialis]
MDTQTRMIDAGKFIEWLDTRANETSQEQAKTQDSEKFHFMNGDYGIGEVRGIDVCVNFEESSFTIRVSPDDLEVIPNE